MKFKAGDKVRYKGVCETFSGKKGGYKPAEGVVVPSSRVGGVTELRLTTPVNSYPTGSIVGLFTTNLELISPEPKKGDKVEVLYPGHVGKTGVVGTKTGNYFYVKLDDSTRELLLTVKEFKIIEEKETKVVTEAIKVGDKVQVDMNEPKSSFHAVEGIVEEITPGKDHGYVRITKSNSKVEAHSPAGKRTYLYGLTKVKEERVGDKFKVGDKIEFVEKVGEANVGDTAVVTRIIDTWLGQYVAYKLDKGGNESDCYPERVKKVEPFTYKDIQKGDTVRRTETWDSGTVKTLEGVVTAVDGTSARTKEGLIVGYYRDADNPHMTLELVERPKPKHWLDEKPVGVVGLFGEGAYKKALTKTSEDLWHVTFLVNGLKHRLSSEECRKQWPSLNYGTDEKVEWIKSK